MKSKRRRNIFGGARGGDDSQRKSEQGAANRSVSSEVRHFFGSIERHFGDCAGGSRPEPVATLRVRADWVNSLVTPSFRTLPITPNGIFRQDFFGWRSKIKFRFFLVASLSGFYSQAAGRDKERWC
jgi:hypothetical protein